MALRMKTLPVKNLLQWIFRELNSQKSIFGIPESKFFRKRNKNLYKFDKYLLETPFGPAAGPHTQLAQNIIASFLAGGRFIELKTVQILDELEIAKPCIDVADEGYNVEWSQELSLEQSFEEYLKAKLIVELLNSCFDFSLCRFSTTVFNMSVGYDLKGIKSEKINSFIEKMKRPQSTVQYYEYLNEIYRSYQETDFLKKYLNESLKEFFDVPLNSVSDSVTLSTMHGCPANEIEDIAKYLIIEKQLTTFIKLNPTLLGYERVREILDRLGYNYIKIKRESFEKDLKLEEAIPMIKRLIELAKKNSITFGIKLSNTLGVVNTKQTLPGDEMYLSGRALFPLTINLAYELAKEFPDDLIISYSGGANINNASKIVDAGIFPVTFATELLKPGGYLRLTQIVNSVENDSNEIIKTPKVNLEKLKELCDEALESPYYKKDFKEIEVVKINKDLPAFDCYIAPCEVICPIHQDVSEYVYLTSQGRFQEAFEVIIEKNPLPHITGYICDHQCMTKCNRWDYDFPVLIRDLKKFAVENAFEEYLKKFKSNSEKNKNGIKIAIIGAGPSGLAAAYFLSRAGFKVTIFEKTNKAGGTVRHTIPQFRIPQEVIDKDVEFIQKHGVEIIYNSPFDLKIDQLKNKGFKYIFIGIGAEIPNELKLNFKNENVFDALDFLKRFNKKEKIKLGRNVIVVGGGNSAMDAARAAKRIEEVENVTIVYRRTIKYMPADKEELNAALEDGIKILELLQPVEFDGEQLKCQKMVLSDFDEDGRQKSIPVENEFIYLNADTIITAIGEKTDLNFLIMNQIKLDEKNKIIIDPETNETSIKNVFVGGDALRGPSTVIESIADGKKVAEAILKREKIRFDFELKKNFKKEMLEMIDNKRGIVNFDLSLNIKELAERCLLCDVICNKCVEVCPNRANLAIPFDNEIFKDKFEIIHIDSICNECGNCETFCPYNGKPYKNKLTIFTDYLEFFNSSSPGFIFIDKNTLMIRSVNGSMGKIKFQNLEDLNKNIKNLINSDENQIKFYSILSKIIVEYSYLIPDFY